MHARLPAAFLAVSCVLACAPAAAQYQGIVSLPPVGPGESRLLVGGSAISRPAYQGSDDRVWTALPYIDYARRDGLFASTGSGVGYSVVNTPQTQLGIRVIPRFGRRQSSSDDLRGMGDIDWGVEGSVYATHALSRQWTVGLNLRAGGKGGEIDVGARRDFVVGPATRMSVFGFATAGNDKSQRTWYGVDAGQSLASGYPVYTPGAGLRNAQVGASVNHFFAGRWIAIGGLGIGRVLGDAADSPIVRERTNVTGFAAIGYQLF
jgi:outer membrane protein